MENIKPKRSNWSVMTFDNKGNWSLRNANEVQAGKTDLQLINFIDNILYSTHIIVNNTELELRRLLNMRYQLGEDYKVILDNNSNVKGITLTNHYGFKIYLRFYRNFMFEKVAGDNQPQITEIMFKQMKWLGNECGLKTFYKHYGIEDIMLYDFKKFVDWDKNFKDMILPSEYTFLENWKQGAFNWLNPEYKGKIIEAKFYDKNSYYQSIWEDNKNVPCGRPINNHSILLEGQDGCQHNLILLKMELTAKLKEGGVPVLSSRCPDPDIIERGLQVTECYRETFWKSLDAFEEVFKNYDVYHFEILDQVCFDNYEGTGFKDFNTKWIGIKNKNASVSFRKNVKIFVNKLLGIQAPRQLDTFKRIFVNGFTESGKLLLEEKEVANTRAIPYIPLYIFVTDAARNEMYKIAKEEKDDLVLINTDCVCLTNGWTDERFASKYKVDDKAIGAFKPEHKGNYFYFNAIGSYIGAWSLDKPGDISIHKHAGVPNARQVDLKNNTLLEAIDICYKKGETNELRNVEQDKDKD